MNRSDILAPTLTSDRISVSRSTANGLSRGQQYNALGLPPRLEWVAAFLFLLPAFAAAISIDGELHRLNLYWLQALIGVSLVAVAIRHRRDIGWLFAAFGVLLLVHVPYGIAHLAPIVGDTYQYLEKFLSLWFYLLLTSLVSVLLLGRPPAISAFSVLASGSVLLGAVAFALSARTGSQVAVHVYGEVVRMQALLTEPSAFAPIVAFLVLIAIRRRQTSMLIFAAVGLSLTFSPTVYLSTVASLLLLGLLASRTRAAVLLVLVSLATILTVARSSFDANALQESASPISSSLGRLLNGIDNVLSLGEEGANVRFLALLETLDFLKEHGLLFTGYGLNSAAVLFLELYDTPKDNALWISMMAFYGIVGCTLFLLACGWALARLHKIRHPYLDIYVPFLVASMINSAQGFLAYSFVIGGVAIAVQSARTEQVGRASPS